MFRRLSEYGGCPSPLPVFAAATALWSDEEHVVANRGLYSEKLDLAERILSNRFGFYRPLGGFFLWLDVGDGEAAAKELWSNGAIRVLPGSYLAAENPDGQNSCAPYIRVALVHDRELMEEVGFVKVRAKVVFPGMATIWEGSKPEEGKGCCSNC